VDRFRHGTKGEGEVSFESTKINRYYFLKARLRFFKKEEMQQT
jgi:hypothetical protein